MPPLFGVNFLELILVTWKTVRKLFLQEGIHASYEWRIRQAPLHKNLVSLPIEAFSSSTILSKQQLKLCFKFITTFVPEPLVAGVWIWAGCFGGPPDREQHVFACLFVTFFNGLIWSTARVHLLHLRQHKFYLWQQLIFSSWFFWQNQSCVSVMTVHIASNTVCP